jgi:2C-methyl-D-erythritol 2,4-cyclodiphosphate synthase
MTYILFALTASKSHLKSIYKIADKRNSKVVDQMAIIIKPHAKQRMKDRAVTEKQIINVLQNPKETISVRCVRQQPMAP